MAMTHQEESSAPHGRQKKWRMENIQTKHPIPKLSDQLRWIIPKDAMPSTSKGWYKASCKAFCLTHRYSVCFVPDPGQFCVGHASMTREGHTRFEHVTENYKNYQNFVQEKYLKASRTMALSGLLNTR